MIPFSLISAAQDSPSAREISPFHTRKHASNVGTGQRSVASRSAQELDALVRALVTVAGFCQRGRVRSRECRKDPARPATWLVHPSWF